MKEYYIYEPTAEAINDYKKKLMNDTHLELNVSLDNQQIIRNFQYENVFDYKPGNPYYDHYVRTTVSIENTSNGKIVKPDTFDGEIIKYGEIESRKQFMDLLDDKSGDIYQYVKKQNKSLFAFYNVVPIKDIVPADKVSAKSYISYINKNGTTYIMLKSLAEIMKATISWDPINREIIIDDAMNKIVLSPDSRSVLINGLVKIMPSKPILINNTTYVSLKEILEAMGNHVDWNEKEGKLSFQLR